MVVGGGAVWGTEKTKTKSRKYLVDDVIDEDKFDEWSEFSAPTLSPLPDGSEGDGGDTDSPSGGGGDSAGGDGNGADGASGAGGGSSNSGEFSHKLNKNSTTATWTTIDQSYFGLWLLSVTWPFTWLFPNWQLGLQPCIDETITYQIT